MQGIDKEINVYVSWLGIHAPKAEATYPIWLKRFDKHTQKRMADITTSDLQSFIEEIHSFSPNRIRFFSKNSVCNAKVVLKAFFGFWIRRGFRGVELSEIKIDRRETNRHRILNEDEYQCILGGFSRTNTRDVIDELVVRLLRDTGVRVSEICALGIKDLDTPNSCAYIENRLSGNRRWLVWSEDSNELLKEYLWRRKFVTCSEYLFVSISERDVEIAPMISPRKVQRLVKSAAERVGLDKSGKPIVPYSFRGKVLKDMQESGYDVEFIQEFLGYTTKSKARRSKFRYSQGLFVGAAKQRLEGTKAPRVGVEIQISP